MIVIDRVMLNTAVIPKRNRPILPPKPTRKLELDLMLKEIIK